MSERPSRSQRTLDLRNNVHLREVKKIGPGDDWGPDLARQTAGSYHARTVWMAPEADTLLFSGCTALKTLPNPLWALRLDVSGCTALEALPERLSCFELIARNTRLRRLPERLMVDYRLDLQGCADLQALPDGLKTGSLILDGCVNLLHLPEGLSVSFLDVSNCVSLRRWPDQGELRAGRLRAANCTGIRTLPSWLTEISQLDISGCTALTEIPDGLRISSWLDIAGSGVTSLPPSLAGVQIRWRGVPIDERIAFQPETITTAEVLQEENVERRRVLLERVGYEAFIRDAGAVVQDQDRDPGGERRLLRIRIPDDEDLVVVSVLCPSTARQYLIRVPPTMQTCRQAVAWTAGFDDPNDYAPLVET